MKNMKKIMLFALAIIVMGSMASCKHQGFKKDKTGFYYKFYEQNDTAAQPELGDVVMMMYTMRTIDSTLDGPRPLQVEILENAFEGDIYDALKLMHVGDSATFILDADSFYHYFLGQEFNLETKDKDLYFDIKLMDLMPRVEVEAMRAEQLKMQQEFYEHRKNAEDSLLTNYIVTNKIRVKPTESGLYFISTSAGKGAKAEAGKLVSVHYEGRTLEDNRVFDSSIQRGEPIEFVLGQGKVIPGWEEGIAMMKEGGKATLIIPSKLAYDSMGAYPVILPYSSLIFDVELVSVKDAGDMKLAQ